MTIPTLNTAGEQPPGVHNATIEEVARAFGQANTRRRSLMARLTKAIAVFKKAGVPRIYEDGSFTTDKVEPNDIDRCWSVLRVNAEDLDPRFWDFDTPEEAQKNRQEIMQKLGLDFLWPKSLNAAVGNRSRKFSRLTGTAYPKGLSKLIFKVWGFYDYQ